MATLNIDIPAAQTQRVLDAFSAVYGFTGKDPTGAMETQAAFLKRKVIDYIKGVVQGQEATVAAETARKTAADAVDAQVKPT